MRADRHLHHLPGDLREPAPREPARPCRGGRASWTSGVHDIRDQTTDPHHQVDDEPFGGGPGHGDEARAGVRGRRVPRSRPRSHDRALTRRSPAGPGARARARGGAVARADLRALRGHRRAGRRGICPPRRSRSATTCSRGRASGPRAARGGHAAGPGRDRQGGVARAGLVRRGGHPGPPPLHAAARVPRDGGSRRARVGEPRGDRAVAARRRDGEDPTEPPRPARSAGPI